MNNSLASEAVTLALTLVMALALTSGCSADQPPAETSNAGMNEPAAVDDSALQQDTAIDESALAMEAVGSDEDMPEAGNIVVAQAQADDEAGEAEQTEQTTESAAPPAKPAGPAPYRIGDHYSVLSPAQPTGADPGKVEISEFFMYSCPHCYNFEAFIEKWSQQKAPYIQFVRIPALFNSPARTHARAFYTAETLGILDEAHMAFFRELHVNRKAMTDENELAAFFANYGVDREAFRQAFNSFAVDTQMRKAEALGRRYRISSTPTVVVNGKYIVNGDKITSYEQILQIADYLAQKEASGG